MAKNENVSNQPHQVIAIDNRVYLDWGSPPKSLTSIWGKLTSQLESQQ